MATVLISPNLNKDDTVSALREVCRILSAHQVHILLPEQMREASLGLQNVTYMDVNEAAAQSDFIVALGGDGTILRIARAAAEYDVPLIGINLGHVGFMTELEKGDIGRLHDLFEKRYEIDSRMMLEVTITRDGTDVYHQTALNDVTIMKKNPFHIIRLGIDADGVPVTGFRGDGVIIATPTGTTAYSLAAGGPVIEPLAENIAVTPVCSHALWAKSFVFAPNREISVRASGLDGSNVYVSADGDNGIEVCAGDIVTVRRAAITTKLIRLKGESFYDILRKKLSDGGEFL